MDCGRRPLLPKICAQIDPPPSENADFDRFRVMVPHPWELARIAIIANRKSTTRFPSSHRWTLCVTPNSPKGWFKTRIFTFGVAFRFLLAGNRRHLKFNTWVEHSKSQNTDDKLSLKWAWPRHVTNFKFLVPLRYLWNGLARDFKFGIHADHSKSQPTDDKLSLKGARSRHVTSLIFGK